MSTVDLGGGFCGCGLSDCGFGEPAEADDISYKILPDISSVSIPRDARLIDLVTKDYVLNSKGKTVGMNSVDQQVYLAIMTTLGSSANFNLGNSLNKIQTFNANTVVSQITNEINLCLRTLVDNKTITINKIEVSLGGTSSRINLIVSYRNRLNNQNNTFSNQG